MASHPNKHIRNAIKQAESKGWRVIKASGIMKTYEFKIILDGVPEVSEQQGEALYQSGCDDGTIVSRDGTTSIRFSRDANSLEEAINSAAGDIQRAGFKVEHVEVPCPV